MLASFEVASVIEAAKLKIRGRPKERLSAQQKVTSTYGLVDGGSTLWYDGICGGRVYVRRPTRCPYSV